MKSPCIGACKNNNGICVGCHRTIKEITQWSSYSDEQRQQLMSQIKGQVTTHQCPRCDKSAQCDLMMGKSQCWCFDVERRETAENSARSLCLCRPCLEKAPLA